MIRNILEYLETNVDRCPEKDVFVDQVKGISYAQFVSAAQCVGSALAQYVSHRSNVAIFIDKSINCLIGMFGAAYANVCYTVIDVESPQERIDAILRTLQPECVITDSPNLRRWQKTDDSGAPEVLLLEDLLTVQADEELLARVRASQVDTDLLYILFTSGSTGVPKGTAICHRSVIAYAESVCRTFNIDESTVWGSQTPFYFSMSILDVFTTAVAGATLCIIPKLYFSFPGALLEYLDEKCVNSLYWVPTAMGVISRLDVFSEMQPSHLERVLFAGEAMPVKCLNYWMEYLPNVLFANLYGPTEITDTCTYYVAKEPIAVGRSVPIGIPFDNCDVFVVDEEGRKVKRPGEKGELYVRGSFVGVGYYNDSEQTAQAFVQNPLQSAYPEVVYRTGDIVAYDDEWNLVYFGRRDHQIKHKGYRIELGEIESAAEAVEGIGRLCCVYNQERQSIILFYDGPASEHEVLSEMKRLVLPYMAPQEVRRIDGLPINMNGKIDRRALALLSMNA